MFGKIKMGAAGVAAAALSLLGAQAAGASVTGPHASLATASASHLKPSATAACGFSCENLFSEQTGSSIIMAVYVPRSNGYAITAKVGDKTDLKFGNDSFTNEDFQLTENDTLGDACPAADQTVPGLLSYYSYSCIQMREGNFNSSFPVIETAWSPDGNQSGLCPGVAVAGKAGEGVTLRDCGQGSGTLWVIDENDVHTISGITYAPAVLGADGNTSDPLVLQVNTGSRNPANTLRVERLDLLTGGFVPNQDMFSFSDGPAL